MAQSTSELITRYANKAAGVYREILDGTSEQLAASPQNVVVVGQFEQGPFMRPVYCENQTTAHAIFGKRNTKLEAKGCYGMLMAEHVLEQGAVWILNIKNIDQYKETLQVKKLAVNSKQQDELINEPIATVYDTNKFWKVDEMYGKAGDGATLALASVAQDKLTVVVEKFWSSEYNYTVAETKKYNENFAGDNLDDNDFVNDYLIRLHVFKTDLATAKLSVANAFLNGQLNMAVLDKIMGDPNAQFFATYSGSVGDVIDINCNNLNIATVVNADTNSSGLFVAINNDAMAAGKTDLLGTEGIIFVEGKVPTTASVTRLGYIFTPELTPKCIHMDSADNTVGYMFEEPGMIVGDVIANEAKTVRLLDKRFVANKFTMPSGAVIGSQEYPVMPDGKPFIKTASGLVYPSNSPKSGMPVEYQQNQALWYLNEQVETQAAWQITMPETAFGNGSIRYILNGASYDVPVILAEDATAEQISDAVIAALQPVTGITFAKGTPASVIRTTKVPASVAYFSIVAISANSVSGAIAAFSTEPTVASNALQTKAYPITVTGNTVLCNGITNDIDMSAVHEMYGEATPVYKLTFSEGISSALATGLPITATNNGAFGLEYNEVINDVAVKLTPICLFKLNSWYKNVTTAPVNQIQGIVSLERHYVNGTAARQNDVLDRLQDVGITASFSDPTIFRCRYMIDAFKTYIEPNAKRQYAQLANEAKRFLCIIPAPFYHELRTSKNPDFHNLLGQFEMSYVAQGNNPDKPSTNSFSYPVSGDSAKYIYPIMNVMYNDGFSSKVVPATGAVGKLFYSKLSGTRKVYDIVAGSDWPVSAAGVVKPEFEAAEPDRRYMEKMGTNVLQVIDGAIQVRSSKTAYQTVLSAFNYPESLEKCFYVSDNVEPTLSGRLFKYNNADARLAVKTKADAVCDIMVADGVIDDYENKCDLENNPLDVRKNGIIVLDTILYNTYGIRIAVHRTTIKDPEA